MVLEIGSHWFPVDLEEAKYAATNIFLNEARLERNNTSIAFLANEITKTYMNGKNMGSQEEFAHEYLICTKIL